MVTTCTSRLTEIDRRLHALYPDRLGNRALMGYSMGAFQSLFVAATGPTNQYSVTTKGSVLRFLQGKQGVKEVRIDPITNQLPLIQFDRYVAINTPVRMAYGISKLDEFYRAPLDWPVAERADDIENTFLKVAALSKLTLTPRSSLPFSAIESKFLIGMTFRFMLRDIIFSSQRRNNQGVLQHPIRNFRREPVYQEILQYSYQDYFEKFAIPYYRPGAWPRRPRLRRRLRRGERRKRWKKPVICGRMTPVCAPIPTSASSSIKTIFSWRTRTWPGSTPRLPRNN